MEGMIMSILTRLRLTAAVLAVAASAAVMTAAPAAAKYHPIYNAQQGWRQVDRNGDGDISKSEWKWAERHGYDRLNGVPKKHLSRKEYQAYLNRYLDSPRNRARYSEIQAARNNNRNNHWNNGNNGWGWQNSQYDNNRWDDDDRWDNDRDDNGYWDNGRWHDGRGEADNRDTPWWQNRDGDGGYDRND
jgi:hypothetical protein